jgi:hypothetical protein
MDTLKKIVNFFYFKMHHTVKKKYLSTLDPMSYKTKQKQYNKTVVLNQDRMPQHHWVL